MSTHSEVAIGREREWYSPEELAAIIGRAAYTVREWCRLGRILARKRASGRGRHLAWEVHAEELWHYVNHGLRPLAQHDSPEREGTHSW